MSTHLPDDPRIEAMGDGGEPEQLCHGCGNIFECYPEEYLGLCPSCSAERRAEYNDERRRERTENPSK